MKAFEFDNRVINSYARFSRSFSTIRSDDLNSEIDRQYRAGRFWPDEAPNLPYSSVVVDEAQDMGEQAFRVIRSIVPEKADGDRTIFIVGDAHQRIYGRRATMTACGINVRGRSRQLRLNYRTSDEIRKWAVSILEGVSVDDFDEGADSLNGYTSVFRGPAPELADFSSEGKEVDALVEWLLAIKAQGTQLSDVGILLRTSSQIDHLTRKLADANIQNIRLRPNMADDRGQPGVRLSTMHRSKGLEFQAVAIPFLAKSVFASPALMRAAADEVDRRSKLQQEKSLLHVAATRAKKLLRVSWSGEPSALIVMPNDI